SGSDGRTRLLLEGRLGPEHRLGVTHDPFRVRPPSRAAAPRQTNTRPLVSRSRIQLARFDAPDCPLRPGYGADLYGRCSVAGSRPAGRSGDASARWWRSP